MCSSTSQDCKLALKLSIVIPCYNEEDSITPLYNELNSALSKLNHDYEIILINDGSNDK
ncbi:MAG: glycosyltransferase, partial [Planctomycetes bacterium]|nr:glycosyltransferase [Planctomycetota bacterium]